MVPRDFRLALNARLRKVRPSIYFSVFVKLAGVSLNFESAERRRSRKTALLFATTDSADRDESSNAERSTLVSAGRHRRLGVKYPSDTSGTCLFCSSLLRHSRRRDAGRSRKRSNGDLVKSDRGRPRAYLHVTRLLSRCYKMAQIPLFRNARLADGPISLVASCADPRRLLHSDASGRRGLS